MDTAQLSRDILSFDVSVSVQSNISVSSCCWHMGMAARRMRIRRTEQDIELNIFTFVP